LTTTGTLTSVSVRRRAVTTTSSICDAVSGSALCVAGVVCAKAGPAAHASIELAAPLSSANFMLVLFMSLPGFPALVVNGSSDAA
jgi:hypothetical protein